MGAANESEMNGIDVQLLNPTLEMNTDDTSRQRRLGFAVAISIL